MTAVLNEVTSLIGSVIDKIAEILALIHWFSDLVFILSLFQPMSLQSIIQGYGSLLIGSLVSSLVTGILAEILASVIPTPLRGLRILVGKIVELMGF